MLIVVEFNSVFLFDWLLVFSCVNDFGLLKCSSYDWDGGFSYLFGKVDIVVCDVIF